MEMGTPPLGTGGANDSFLGSGESMSLGKQIVNPDVILIGSGVMSAHLGALIKSLDPKATIQVYESTAELAREIHRIAFLDQRRRDHAGREDVERNDPLERFGG